MVTLDTIKKAKKTKRNLKKLRQKKHYEIFQKAIEKYQKALESKNVYERFKIDISRIKRCFHSSTNVDPTINKIYSLDSASHSIGLQPITCRIKDDS